MHHCTLTAYGEARVMKLLCIGAMVGLAVLGVTDTAKAACQLQQVADYHITMEGNQPLIDASINGHPVRLLVDIGSAATIISRPAAQALGLTLRRMDGMDFYGVGGGDVVDQANIHELKLGDAVVHDVDLIVTGPGLKSRRYVGLLGQNFLSRLDVEFDFANGAMRLFKPKDCVGDQVVYWGKAYSVIPIAPSTSNGVLETEVILNGRKILAQVDTGASISVVTTGTAERVGVTVHSEGVQAAGPSGGMGAKQVQTAVAVFPTFTIGDETIKNAKLHIADLFGEDQATPINSRVPRKLEGFPQMLLGADFIRAHRIYVARSQGKIYFSYNGGPIFQVLGPRADAARPVGPGPGDAVPAKP
jgi:clan AA aspartic protease (TIGR02281 family)